MYAIEEDKAGIYSHTQDNSLHREKECIIFLVSLCIKNIGINLGLLINLIKHLYTSRAQMLIGNI